MGIPGKLQHHMRTATALAALAALLVLVVLAGTASAAYRQLHITWTFVSTDQVEKTTPVELTYGEFGETPACNTFHTDGTCTWQARPLSEVRKGFEDDAPRVSRLAPPT